MPIPTTRLMTVSDMLLALLRRQGPGIRVQTFHEGNFLVTLAPIATFTDVVSFSLPAHMAGQVEGFTFGCEILADFDQVIWQLKIDGAPQQGYDFIQGPLSTFVFPKIIADPLPIRGGATVSVAAKALAQTQGNIAAALLGTYWPAGGPDRQADLTGHVTAQL
jgi:hypothetical protein